MHGRLLRPRSRGDARQRQDGGGRRCRPLPRRQCACLHDDKRPAPRQGNGCGDRITGVSPPREVVAAKLIATGLGRVGDDHQPDLPARRLATFLRLKLGAVLCGFDDGYYRNGGESMNMITPFLWFNDNAEDAAEFYLSVFPKAKKVGELRSSGVGPGNFSNEL